MLNEIRRTPDKTRESNVEEPKSPDTLRRICTQANQAKQQTEKQIVLSDRATPENPGLYGGMWRRDGASSSGGDRGDSRIIRRIDEISGEDIILCPWHMDKMSELIEDLGARPVIVALKRELEINRKPIIFQVIAKWGNRTEDFPCLERVFIEEGHKYSGFEGWGCGGPLCGDLVRFGGERATPALERVFRHYESQGYINNNLLDAIAGLKGDGTYRIGSELYKRTTRYEDLGRKIISIKCLSPSRRLCGLMSWT